MLERAESTFTFCDGDHSVGIPGGHAAPGVGMVVVVWVSGVRGYCVRERSRSDMLHGVDSSHVLFYLMSPCTVCRQSFVMIRSARWALKDRSGDWLWHCSENRVFHVIPHCACAWSSVA